MWAYILQPIFAEKVVQFGFFWVHGYADILMFQASHLHVLHVVLCIFQHNAIALNHFLLISAL